MMTEPADLLDTIKKTPAPDFLRDSIMMKISGHEQLQMRLVYAIAASFLLLMTVNYFAASRFLRNNENELKNVAQSVSTNNQLY